MICHLHPYTINHLHDAEYIKHLGSGAFGDVKLYKCKEKNKGCTCNQIFVVKQIKCHKYKNDSLVVKKLKKNLLNEYTIGTLLHHPYIRETLDVDLEDNSIIFEYCPGKDFFNLITDSVLSKDDALLYFKQLIEGVSYMHKIGVAHMDLKLENILVDLVHKKVKIIDFGEARVFHDSLHIVDVIPEKGLHGSLPYVAPEEFTDKEYSPEKVDVWSCGIILYEIVYRAFPWSKANLTDEKYKKYVYNISINNLGIIFPHYPSRQLLTLMLKPNPNERCSIDEAKNKISELII